MKECEKNVKCKKKRILKFSYKHGLLLEKFKDSNKFKEMYKENGESKTRKSIIKISKTQSGNEFK